MNADAARARKGWSRRRWAAFVALLLFLVAAAGALAYWRDDLLRTSLDPKQPFQTYTAPPAPDYAKAAGWALLPEPRKGGAALPPADVFFVHSATYDGGREWNGPVDDPAARRRLAEEVLPNFAAPFARVGRVFAPRLRQASLYSSLTLRDDARDARRFAYADVKRAFDAFLARTGGGRPIVLVGVEQGGLMVERLGQEVARDPAVSSRLAAVYLIDATAPAAAHAPGSPLPACAARDQSGCVVAYQTAPKGDFTAKDRLIDHAAMWTPAGWIEPFRGEALCVNPLTGALGAPAAGEAANLGAAAATRLEWGLRPALLAGQVSATCKDGLLRVTRPRSPNLQRSTAWPEHLREPPFNLFWADLEADAVRRVAAFGRAPHLAPPITQVEEVGKVARPPP